jgi:alkylation response protein AidB-like acyl-CoA dehydrogenase
MDFDYPGEDDPRRKAVRAWFDAHPDPTPRQLYESGYLVCRWPAPYGVGADPELQLIIDDEIARAGVDLPENGICENHCGPSLLTHGTEAAKARYLEKGLVGEERWCQLFSEPSGGSDLANVKTTATREGDHYVIRGQKVWNSGATYREIGVLIARTDPHAAKHAGLSSFIVEMKTPGISVRPIADMSGYASEFNEVYFDEVRVPVANRLGEEGDGWRLTMQQLQSERARIAKPGVAGGPTVHDLVMALHRAGALRGAGIADEAAQLYVEGEMMRLLGYRMLSDQMNAKQAGPEAAIVKLIGSPLRQKIYQLAMKAQGQIALVDGAEQFAGSKDYEGRLSWNYGPWFSPAFTLQVGTQEIMRNVIGERMLGLPRDLDPTAKGDWSEHQRTRAAAQ